MKITHTEASLGWGGQEIRTFNEAMALRKKGHEVFFIVQEGAKLGERARQEGFDVLEINFFKKFWLISAPKVIKFLRKNKINLVVTHSSLDAWLAGICAKGLKIPVIRVRHVSTPTRPGINAKLLFGKLADFIITTSQEIIEPLAMASGKSKEYIRCIPTGVDPSNLSVEQEDIEEFKNQWEIKDQDLIVGTVCVVRSWKGISTLIDAANLLKDEPNLKWFIVGGGYLEQHINRVKELGLEHIIKFTGHLENPKIAMASLDVFLLLSTANEGISQATLQASYLQKPMITTSTGGLKEVCLDGQTGFVVPCKDARATADAILKFKSRELRVNMGQSAKNLVNERFLFEKTLQDVENVYARFAC